MKKNELKQVLKPLIKECIKEVIFEEGVLSGIISEVVKGMNGAELVVETKQQSAPLIRQDVQQQTQLHKERRRALAEVNKSAYGGLDLFEGTTPISSAGTTGQPNESQNALSGVAPHDSGVDISELLNLAGGSWKQI